MGNLWFVYSNNIVSGPFTTEQVNEQLARGEWASSSFIWWKGQREWLPVAAWKEQLPNLISNKSSTQQTPVWYLDIGKKPIGPLTQAEMIDNLRNISNLARVRIWTAGLDKWTKLFEMHEVMEELGLSRRENDRAPLMGTVLVARAGDNHPAVVAQAASISIAGIGLNEAPSLLKGEDVQLLIRSSEFTSPLRLRGSVIYVTSGGYAGLRFSNVHPETQSLIYDYVKRFKLPFAKSTGQAA